MRSDVRETQLDNGLQVPRPPTTDHATSNVSKEKEADKKTVQTKQKARQNENKGHGCPSSDTPPLWFPRQMRRSIRGGKLAGVPAERDSQRKLASAFESLGQPGPHVARTSHTLEKRG